MDDILAVVLMLDVTDTTVLSLCSRHAVDVTAEVALKLLTAIWPPTVQGGGMPRAFLMTTVTSAPPASSMRTRGLFPTRWM